MKNYHLLSSFFDPRSENAALEFVLFTMLVSNPDKIFSDKDSLATERIIAYIPSKLSGKNSLETMWFKFKYFLELFYFYPGINEEDIWNILYDLKNKTVSYKAKKVEIDQ